ncbi:hypothetical protein [Xanthomonas translucens]|uniref:hypothetical protein n=1 Tax=Xanthomonas campestris pv. translucens TaxID=343 RepID=UPI0012D9FD23|nr:hypothetical protein [Xanthomonas translucens]UJB15424.1 hypothetical protein LTC53_01555 [Xanthomonas translucens pv. undulosa]
MKRYIHLVACIMALSGCASAPQQPQEPEISVELNGTAVEVQSYIEEKLRGNPQTAPLKVDSANDRAIVFKGDCMRAPNMGALKCAAIMMGVGNSGWDGPYNVFTFRTAEIRGVVRLSVSTEWCATNAFGKKNCMPDGNNAARNQMLRAVKEGYDRAKSSSGSGGAP